MTIIEFILARIAEDERIAQTSIDVTYRTFRPAGEWTFTDGEEEAERESQRRGGGRIKFAVHASVTGGNFTLDRCGNPRTQNPDLIHIARHDPARILRNVESNRRILALYRRCVEVGEQTLAEGRRPDDRYDAMEQALEMVLSSLAAEWSDHPDFNPKWTTGVEEWLDDSD